MQGLEGVNRVLKLLHAFAKGEIEDIDGKFQSNNPLGQLQWMQTAFLKGVI